MIIIICDAKTIDLSLVIPVVECCKSDYIEYPSEHRQDQHWDGKL